VTVDLVVGQHVVTGLCGDRVVLAPLSSPAVRRCARCLEFDHARRTVRVRVASSAPPPLVLAVPRLRGKDDMVVTEHAGRLRPDEDAEQQVLEQGDQVGHVTIGCMWLSLLAIAKYYRLASDSVGTIPASGASGASGAYTSWSELRRLRLNAGYSISTLAAAVGLGQPHLSLVEKGQRGVSDVTLVRLARVLGVEPAVLDRSRPKIPSRKVVPRRSAKPASEFDSTRRRHHHPVDGDGGERKAIA